MQIYSVNIANVFDFLDTFNVFFNRHVIHGQKRDEIWSICPNDFWDKIFVVIDCFWLTDVSPPHRDSSFDRCSLMYFWTWACIKPLSWRISCGLHEMFSTMLSSFGFFLQFFVSWGNVWNLQWILLCAREALYNLASLLLN